MLPDNDQLKKVNPFAGKDSWQDHYFAEMEPEERLKILETEPGAEDAETAALLKKLFDQRYEKKSNGIYADRFLYALISMKQTAENLNAVFAKRQNRKAAEQALHTLCLDEASGYPKNIIYQELCQVTARYVTLCTSDKTYNSVILGFGKISDERALGKITSDLEQISAALPEAMGMEREFLLLREAVQDIQDRLL